jgi:Tfp pilus assembly protein PilN
LPVGKIVSGVVLGYLVIASLALTWRETALNQEVTALKQTASSLVEQQNKLDQQLELIDNYHQLFAKNVSYSEMLQLLGSQLQNIATIDSLSMTENLVIIRGTAKSATAVLAKLGEMPMWQESRFTQPVQTGNEVDVFVISTIYVPTKPLESQAQQQAPASMLEKSAETQP